LWYWQVRKREPVLLDDALRHVTLVAIEVAHKVLASGNTPPPTDKKKRCKACSLTDLCEPDTFRQDHSGAYIEGLFTELTGSDLNEN
jgi:CRISPR-associated exonuclease Cas4